MIQPVVQGVPQREPLSPPPAPLLILFSITLAIAVACFGYASWRLLRGLPLADGPGGPQWLPPALAVAVGAVTLLMGVRWIAFFLFAFIASRRPCPGPFRARWPRVSILVPAFNEGQTIEAALASLLEIDYPAIEIIVVDDGSRDDTLQRARAFEGDHGHAEVRVFTKPNGGKWSALNFAYHRSTSELLLCVDADSRLDPCALRRMVRRMADPQVGGVAGQVRVRNRTNLLTLLQGLEYVIANGLVRMAQSVTGTVLVIPGPIGLFRRSVLEEIHIRYGARLAGAAPGHVDGPFEGDTFAEDFDLSIAILSLGLKTVYEPDAVSHTKAPDRPFALLNQRYRWCRGTLQVLGKYARRARAEPAIRRPRLLAWLAATYFAELGLLPAVYALSIALSVLFLASGGDVLPMLRWAAAFWLLNLNAAALFAAVHRDSLRLLAVMPLFDAYQTLLINSGWAIAVIDQARGRGMRW